MPYQSLTHEFRALGTDVWVEIVLTEESLFNRAAGIRPELEAFYARFERIFSRFDSKSELSRCNTALGEWQAVSPEFLKVAEQAVVWHDRSRGYFDPRIIEHLRAVGYGKSFAETDFSRSRRLKIPAPPAGRLSDSIAWKGGELRLLVPMDFSGIAKGFITDRAAEFLRQEGFGNFLLDSGGDIYASGHDEIGNRWHIALEHATEEIAFYLSDQSIATSGITRRQWHIEGMRFHHLINPYAPERFSFDLLSVTVVSDDTETADILAKTLFLMGREAGCGFADREGIPAVFLLRDGTPVYSQASKEILDKGKSV